MLDKVVFEILEEGSLPRAGGAAEKVVVVFYWMMAGGAMCVGGGGVMLSELAEGKPPVA